MDPVEQQTIDAFHHLFYYGSPDEEQVLLRTYWMNVPCVKCPLDLWVIQEILCEIRPDLVIETGTLFGGSALFMAHVLDVLGKGRIVTIDIRDFVRPQHPRIQYVTGSSIDPELIHSLFGRRPAETRLVLLDSDHDKEHVLRELRLFAPYVSVGSYLIVEDTNINGHPIFPDFGPGAYEAIEEFLGENTGFTVDLSREKFKLTFNPHGFLRRVR